MDPRETRVQLYKELRKEILQSVRFQNRVAITGGIVVAIVYGLQISGILKDYSEQTHEVIIASLPPIITLAAALWVAEYSRMRRAGEYLIYLEKKINDEVGDVSFTWETYLHSDNTTKKLHETFYQAQRVLYIGFFGLFGALSISLYINVILETSIREVWVRHTPFSLANVLINGFAFYYELFVQNRWIEYISTEHTYLYVSTGLLFYIMVRGWPVIKHSDENVGELVDNIEEVEETLEEELSADRNDEETDPSGLWGPQI